MRVRARLRTALAVLIWALACGGEPQQAVEPEPVALPFP